MPARSELRDRRGCRRAPWRRRLLAGLGTALFAGAALGSAPAGCLTKGRLEKEGFHLYRQAMKSFYADDWRSAACVIQQVLLEQARPIHREPVPVVGRKREFFLPYYHLGVCLFHLDDCDGAKEAFDRSWDEGCIDAYKTELEDMRLKADDCQENPRSSPEFQCRPARRADRAGALSSALSAAPRPSPALCAPPTPGVAPW